MKIAAVIVSFDDERGLLRYMNFIHDFFDLMIVVDGKFRWFEDALKDDLDLVYKNPKTE